LTVRKHGTKGAADKKIALFVSSFEAGGVQRIMVNLANELWDSGYIVQFVAVTNRGPLIKLINPQISVKHLDSKRVLFSLKELIKFFKSEKIDVFVSGQTHLNAIAIIAQKLAGNSSQMIVTEHNHMSSVVREGRNWVNRLRPLWAKLLYHFADDVVTVSAGVADDLSKVSGIRREKIKVVFNPAIDETLFRDKDLPVNHPWFQDTGSPIVLGVGRLAAQKDFSNLIQAIRIANEERPIRLIILGEGQERKNLEGLVDALNLSELVSLPGNVENPFAYMKNADLFVLSSAWEGLSTVLIEAMACGTSVVSTDCPSGPREILEDGKYGMLVPVGDAEALAEGILKVLANPSEADELRERAHHFLSSEAVKNYTELFND